MATFIEPRLPRGMRDIVPQKMLQRRYVMRVIENVFERFGFEPLQTPALELAQTLLGKYGPDAEKLIYDARHREGKEDLALRYDLSVPLSRVVAMNPELTKPFKRYQIAPVWRAERPQKGRYREFYQCDADIVGTSSMLADAEIIAMIFTILSELGFKEFVTKVNNRKLLTAIGKFSAVPSEQLGSLYRTIDKFDKIGFEGVMLELNKVQLPYVTQRLWEFFSIAQEKISSREKLDKLVSAFYEIREVNGEKFVESTETTRIAEEGISELRQILDAVKALNVPERFIEVDFLMVRGLEYYTGPIFETVVTEPKIGSLTGGGRYDSLIGLFSKNSLPATGTTVGIERIIDVMDELNMFPPELGKTVTQVFVTVFNAKQRDASIALTMQLRASGINAEMWYDTDGLGKQLKYAAAKGIPFAMIVGPDEAAANLVTLRDLKTGEQLQIARGEIANTLQAKLSHA